MGKMKELFMQYQEEMHRHDEFIDDEHEFEQWCLQMQMNEEYCRLNAQRELSIFPDDMFYDDEYYKSTYHPTNEDEEAAFKLFNKEK